MLTTLGVLEEPLGNTRLHVARLVASLLYTSSASHAVVAQELCRLNTMDLLLVRWPKTQNLLAISKNNVENARIDKWSIGKPMLLFLQDLFFKYTWNNFLHLQVELCVAAILRPCAHEMRLQPGLGSQDKFKQHQDESQDQAVIETPPLEPSLSPDNSAHNLMVTHVGVFVCV